QKASVGNVHHLQLIGIVINLYRNRIHVLPAAQENVHSESSSLGLSDRRRIEDETRAARRRRLWLWRRRLWSRLRHLGRSRSLRLITVLCRRRGGGRLLGEPPQLDSVGCTDVQHILISSRKLLRPDDVRHQRENNLVLTVLSVGL